MSIILLHAGELADPRDLQECLREVHEHHRAERLADIARRTTNGTLHSEPLGPVEDPGPFVADPRLDGIKVRLRVLSERRRSILDGTHAKHLGRLLKADEQNKKAIAKGEEPPVDDEAMAELSNAVFDSRRAYVAEVIAGIEGVAGVEMVSGGALSESTLDALERAKLINPLFVASQHLQGLDAKKADRYGQSPASTSATSTVPSAHSIATALAVATEAVSTSTGAPTSSPATATQPTPALGGT